MGEGRSTHREPDGSHAAIAVMMTNIEVHADPHGGAPPHDGLSIAASLDHPEQFGEVFDRHFDAIHRYVARRLGNDLADDLSATVFTEAFRTRSRFETDRVNARPWLYGITANVMRHHHRREATQWRSFAKHGVDPLGMVDNPRTDELAVAVALGTITAEEREALLLFAWADLSYDDIAIALNVPIGTVRSRINRARTKLRPALEHLREGN